jgi:hypothetical protein
VWVEFEDALLTKKMWDIKRKERDRGGVGMVIPKLWTTTMGNLDIIEIG